MGGEQTEDEKHKGNTKGNTELVISSLTQGKSGNPIITDGPVQMEV